jgi:hypothetical protein
MEPTGSGSQARAAHYVTLAEPGQPALAQQDFSPAMAA